MPGIIQGMSDQKLRELERRLCETDSVEDEAAYLRERVRAGALNQERLELAAYCGHEGARRAVPCVSSAELSLLEWTQGLARWGKVTLLHAAWFAISALPPWSQIDSGDDRPLHASEALRAWLACPCDPHQESAVLHGTNAETAGNGMDSPACHHAWAIAEACRACGEADGHSAMRSVIHACAAQAHVGNWYHAAIEVADRQAAFASLGGLLTVSLRDWALNMSHPT